MRVFDDVLKCVGFVSKDKNIVNYRSTAFIVSVLHDDGYACLHLITVKHLALSILDGEACIAVNAKDRLPRWMKQGDVRWYFHPPDESVDVAVLPMASAVISNYDVVSVPIHLFVNEEVIREEKMGLGETSW